MLLNVEGAHEVLDLGLVGEERMRVSRLPAIEKIVGGAALRILRLKPLNELGQRHLLHDISPSEKLCHTVAGALSDRPPASPSAR
jgi:hypothetical protein